jgi:hypothetical protein
MLGIVRWRIASEIATRSCVVDPTNPLHPIHPPYQSQATVSAVANMMSGKD